MWSICDMGKYILHLYGNLRDKIKEIEESGRWPMVTVTWWDPNKNPNTMYVRVPLDWIW